MAKTSLSPPQLLSASGLLKVCYDIKIAKFSTAGTTLENWVQITVKVIEQLSITHYESLFF